MDDGRETVRIQCFHLPNTSTHTTRHDSFNQFLQYGCVWGWGGGGVGVELRKGWCG